MDNLFKFYAKHGYVVIPGLLSKIEAEEYKNKLQKLSHLSDSDFDFNKAKKGGWFLPDGVTQTPDFWPLIINERLINAIRQIFGPTVKYAQHSDLHVHHGTMGWHRDSAYREFGIGPDWDESQEKYQVARVAIYLQSYKKSKFKLGLVPKSHRKYSFLNKLEFAFWSRVQRFLKKEFLFPFLTRRAVWIKLDPGDCIIFDQRLLHTGTRTYGPKYSIYLAYGVDNQHLRNHRTYYWETRKELGYKPCPPELQKQLEAKGLFFNV